MILRKLIIFRHDSPIGNAPSHKMFERVVITSKTDGNPARSYNDYDIRIDRDAFPDGITLIEKE